MSTVNTPLPLVALIGRTNVGKSTLFNRLIRANKALTHDQPGVTRDRLYGEVRYSDRPFALVDTGGLVLESSQGFDEDIMSQAMEALEAAQLICFVVDGQLGLTPLDEQLADFLRRSGKPILLVVNKVDGPEQEAMRTADFHGMGLPLTPVSAEHKFGLRTLIERIEELLPENGTEEEIPVEGLRLALLGRPNVGKSSIINALSGEQRLIVSPVAGTTRDSVDVVLVRGGRQYVFLDTAGVRRKSQVVDTLERFSILRSLKSSKQSQVTVLVLDAPEGVVGQDKRLISFLDKEKVPLIIAVNKIDLLAAQQLRQLKVFLGEQLRFCDHVPVVYTSTVTRAGLGGILPLAEKLWQECQTRVSTGKLNRAVREVTSRQQPPVVNRRRAKFYYLTQVRTAPPTFVFFVNDPELIRESYAKYLEKQLRKLFGLRMAPVQLVFRPSHQK